VAKISILMTHFGESGSRQGAPPPRALPLSDAEPVRLVAIVAAVAIRAGDAHGRALGESAVAVLGVETRLRRASHLHPREGPLVGDRPVPLPAADILERFNEIVAQLPDNGRTQFGLKLGLAAI